MSENQTVFRRPTKNNLFASKRSWAQDQRISNGARGLLARMLSMPQDWEFYQSHLVKNSLEGKDAIRSQMKELVRFGYLVKMPRKRNEDGTFSNIEYDVWDEAQITQKLTDEQVNKIFSPSYSFDDFLEIYPAPRSNHDDFKETCTRADYPTSDNPTSDNPHLQYRQSTIPSEDKTTTKPKESKKNVVVFLQELDVPDPYKNLLSLELDEEKAKLLVKRVKRWKERKNDFLACRVIMKRWDSWDDNMTEREKQNQKEIEEANRQKRAEENKKYAQKIVTENPKLPFTVRAGSLEIRDGKKISILPYTELNFLKILEYSISVLTT